MSHTLSTDRVPLQGVATPVKPVGDDPDELAALLTPAGMRLTVVGTEPGVAAARNLLRSTLVNGLPALVIESLRAAEKAGQPDWYRGHLAEVLTGIDDAFIERLVTGTVKHQVRRAQEMEPAAARSSNPLSRTGSLPSNPEPVGQYL